MVDDLDDNEARGKRREDVTDIVERSYGNH